jgi:hypothetical protein
MLTFKGTQGGLWCAVGEGRPEQQETQRRQSKARDVCDGLGEVESSDTPGHKRRRLARAQQDGPGDQRQRIRA